MIVKQLESELQTFRKKHAIDPVRTSRIGKLGQTTHYQSLEPEARGINYRYNVVEMKKALGYFLNNKETDF